MASGKRDSNLRECELSNGRKYLQIICWIRDLYSEDIKNAYNSIIKKTNKKLQTEHRLFFKGDIQ